MTIAAERSAHSLFVRNQWLLSAAQVFSGIGIAVGFAVGGLLAEKLTGSAEYAGFAQTASILGAGVLAIPLARLAERRSRSYALSLGFSLAALGALIILVGVRIGVPVVFFVGMALFGSATATGLQARYAATDSAPAHLKGRALSVVVWAATVGSVAGPNLADPGGELGIHLGVGELGGPFALSAVAFLVAIAFTSRLRRRRQDVPDPLGTGAAEFAAPAGTASYPAAKTPAQTRPTIRQALHSIKTRPRALLGFTAVVLGHTIMVSVMVMTPVHMAHSGDTIAVIGIVISLHIMGMYALSPMFGWAADRFGPIPVIWLGFALFTASAIVGIADDLAGSSMLRISTALVLLGLGWSACFIAGSTLISESVPDAIRVTVQGATDASMNLGAAVFAAVAGPLLTVGGFTLINAVALGIVALGVLVAIRAMAANSRSQRPDRERPDSQRPDSERPDSERPDSERPDSQRSDSQRSNGEQANG
ncbi:MAG: MFS transporter [Nakamurella sp.]